MLPPTALPDTLPVFPLTGALLLPAGRLPLRVFEPRYLQMTDDALRGNRLIGIIQPVTGEGAAPRLYTVAASEGFARGVRAAMAGTRLRWPD